MRFPINQPGFHGLAANHGSKDVSQTAQLCKETVDGSEIR